MKSRTAMDAPNLGIPKIAIFEPKRAKPLTETVEPTPK
jgi:hypothetical protein